MSELKTRPYTLLAVAIVKQAVIDWQEIRVKPLNKRTESEKSLMEECEEFFLSPWFALLTDIDGKDLLNALKREFKEGGRREQITYQSSKS